MVLGTAYFRGRIPYELFYLPHLMTLVIYVLATVHTLDDQFRTGTVVGKNRSQSFKWFAGSIAIYTLDQIWRAYHSSRETMVLSAATAADGRTVLLHVNRPSGFRFKPGQYASLNIPGYGVMWHPSPRLPVSPSPRLPVSPSHRPSLNIPRCGVAPADIVLDHFPRLFQLHATPHAPCNKLYQISM